MPLQSLTRAGTRTKHKHTIMKYAFAGDRNIAVSILELLIQEDQKPLALMVSSDKRQTHAAALTALSGLDTSLVFKGKEFTLPQNVETLRSLDLDYIIGIHFPYIIPRQILDLPKVGVINLHPAFLPYNKGWHTPSWAIIDGTPYGATLHFMSEKLDAGDIIHQKQLEIAPNDTADTLYKKALLLEYEVFKEALPDLLSLDPPRKKQPGEGTSHSKADLDTIREIKLNEKYNARDFIHLLRGLSTNTDSESAFFEENGKKYGIKIDITPLNPT